MATLIMRAPGALSAPIAGTPVIPDLSRGILFDFDADTIAMNENDPIQAWLNSQGSWGASANLTLSATERPRYAKNGVAAGHASANFTASPATSIRTTSTAPITPAVNTPITVAALVKFNSAADGTNFQNVFSGRTVEKYVSARRNASGRMSMGANAADQIFTLATAPVNTWFVLTCVFNGANSALFVEKSKTVGTTSQAEWDGIVLGANAISAANMSGGIAAIRAYTRALSDAEVFLLREQMMTSRGLAA